MSALLLASFLALAASVQDPPALPDGLFVPVTPTDTIESVTVGPIFEAYFLCSEHKAGTLTVTGDALGADCQVQSWAEGDGPMFAKPYRTDGATNEDWYGWGADVISPFDGVVLGLHVNPVANTPGEMGQPPAGMVLIRREDGVTVLLAHVDEPVVREGETVRRGQKVGAVGNNGMSRNPHIHIGAYRGTTPLQIRWDLTAETP